MAHSEPTKAFSKQSPETATAVCTLRVHRPTSPCAPITSASAPAPLLHPLQLLFPDCVLFNCCSSSASTCTCSTKSITNTKVAHHCCSPAPQTSQFRYTQTDTHLKSQYNDDTAPGGYTPAPTCSCSHLQSRNLEPTRTYPCTCYMYTAP